MIISLLKGLSVKMTKSEFLAKSRKCRKLLESKKIYAMYPLPEVNYSWMPDVGPHLLYRRAGELMLPIDCKVAKRILRAAKQKEEENQ